MGELAHRKRPRLAFVLDDDAKVGAVFCDMLAALGVLSRHFADISQIRWNF
jgi:hypothetical protein